MGFGLLLVRLSLAALFEWKSVMHSQGTLALLCFGVRARFLSLVERQR